MSFNFQRHVSGKSTPSVRKEIAKPRRRFLAAVGCRGGALDDNPPAADAPDSAARGRRGGGRGAGQAPHPMEAWVSRVCVCPCVAHELQVIGIARLGMEGECPFRIQVHKELYICELVQGCYSPPRPTRPATRAPPLPFPSAIFLFFYFSFSFFTKI